MLAHRDSQSHGYRPSAASPLNRVPTPDERLARIRSPKAFNRRDSIFFEGDPAEQVFEIVEGLVGVHKLLPDGRRQVIGFLHPGDFLGLALGDTYLYTAEAVTAVTAFRYERPRFERQVDQSPALARRLLHLVSTEMQAAQDHVLLLGRKSAAEKVATFVLELAERAGDGETEVSVPMVRGDIADYLGLTTETVSRVFTRLRQQGIVDLPSLNKVTILDRDALENLAEGDDDTGSDSWAA